jgi:[CysO sulfur-carrier protein]-thiocarboxylate-dependent cysteine synthase
VKYTDVLNMVGNTPHVRVRCESSAAIYLKVEGCNPTGSIKDRAGLHMILNAIERGSLKPHQTLLDASSGNMACAIAFYGKMLGYQTKVVVNSKVTASKKDFISYFGAEVEQVGDFTIDGNRYCRELAEKDDRYYFLDQLHNWANPEAHYQTTGPEILNEFPDITMLVGSLGSGGSLLGTARALKEKAPHVKVVAVEAASGTKLPGTGSFDDGDYVSPFISKGYEERFFDEVIKINESDAIRVTHCLKQQGLFCGLQTGGVVHAAHTVARRDRVKGNVVVLSGDSGWKNIDKLLQI